MKQVMLYLFCIVCTSAMAQNKINTQTPRKTATTSQASTAAKTTQDLTEDTISASSVDKDKIADVALPHPSGATRHLINANYRNNMPWGLHKGLNAQFGLSLTAGFGKYAPRGVGFGQHVALTYALPLNKHWSLAAGLYADHLNWDGNNMTNAGVSALLSYQVNEKLCLYAYGEKNFFSGHRPATLFYGPYSYFNTPSERLGVGAEYKVNETLTLGLNFEHAEYDHPAFGVVSAGSLMRPYRGADW